MRVVDRYMMRSSEESSGTTPLGRAEPEIEMYVLPVLVCKVVIRPTDLKPGRVLARRSMLHNITGQLFSGSLHNLNSNTYPFRPTNLRPTLGKRT